jgi:hypothetical protein
MQPVRRAFALSAFFVGALVFTSLIGGCSSSPTSTGTGVTAAALDIVSGDEQVAGPSKQLRIRWSLSQRARRASFRHRRDVDRRYRQWLHLEQQRQHRCSERKSRGYSAAASTRRR